MVNVQNHFVLGAQFCGTTSKKSSLKQIL